MKYTLLLFSFFCINSCFLTAQKYTIDYSDLYYKTLMLTWETYHNHQINKEKDIELAAIDTLTSDINRLVDVKKMKEEWGPQIAGLMQQFYEKGEWDGMQFGDTLGFQEQLVKMTRMVFAYKLKKGKDNPLTGKFSPNWDTDELVKQLATIQKRPSKEGELAFGNVVETVNVAVLEALMDLLPDIESEDIHLRYQEIHPLVTRLLYFKFLELEWSKQRFHRPSFYTYPAYRSTETFVLVLSSILPNLVDALFTYVYEDWAKVSELGLKVGGTTTQFLQHEIMKSIKDDFIVKALEQDYDNHKKQLTQLLKKVLANINIGTREDKQITTGTISKSRNFTAHITMEILTKIIIGFDVDHLSIDVDHKEKEFIVSLTDLPKMQKMVLQDYVVRPALNEVFVNCGFFNFRARKKRISISQSKIKDIYKSNVQPVESLAIYKNPITQNSVMLHLEPSIKKIFEPALALFGSCYKVRLEFGSTSTVIINHQCPNNAFVAQ